MEGTTYRFKAGDFHSRQRAVSGFSRCVADGMRGWDKTSPCTIPASAECRTSVINDPLHRFAPHRTCSRTHTHTPPVLHRRGTRGRKPRTPVHAHAPILWTPIPLSGLLTEMIDEVPSIRQRLVFTRQSSAVLPLVASVALTALRIPSCNAHDKSYPKSNF